MIEVFPVTLPRLSGKQSRRVYVYVPDALAADPDARYPVLYMFDDGSTTRSGWHEISGYPYQEYFEVFNE